MGHGPGSVCGCTDGNGWCVSVQELGPRQLSQDSPLTRKAPLVSSLLGKRRDLRFPISERAPLISTPGHGRGEPGSRRRDENCGLLSAQPGQRLQLQGTPACCPQLPVTPVGEGTFWALEAAQSRNTESSQIHSSIVTFRI